MKARGFQPDTGCYNAVVSACARCAQPERAFGVVEDMRAARLMPNTRTYSSLLNACASSGLIKRAEEVVAAMRAEGHTVDEYTHAALIDCHAVAHSHAHAADRRESPETARAAAAGRAAALATCVSLAEAARDLPELQASPRGRPGGMPRVVLNALLGAHVALREYDAAFALFKAAEQKEGLPPSATSYRHAIAATLRAAGGVPPGTRMELAPPRVQNAQGGLQALR